MADRFVQIDVSAFVIEVDAHVRVPLRGFDYRGVKGSAPDRVDAFFGINIIRREMQCAGFIMNHAATHRDRVPQRFVSDPDLFERMNPTRRNCQIDRTSANNVAFARISSPLVKIDFVTASPKVRGQQSTCEAAADKNEFSGHQEILNRGLRGYHGYSNP